MPTLDVQTTSESLYTRISDALASNQVSLTEQAREELTAMVYPILFTKDGLSKIEGNSDHWHKSVMIWDCICGEEFSHSFDGRDEMHAHFDSFLLEWDEIIALVRAEFAMALPEDAPVEDAVIALFRSMGQYWLFPGLVA